ncbi:MAG: hypothetical protein HYV07_24560 [Deltaproteobacteria bacterium]|nr:hypothetical protein [Deltaproteobacteria bacterium]
MTRISGTRKQSGPIPAETPISQIKTIAKKAPDLVQKLGPSTTAGTLRQIFGSKSISQIASMPVTERAAQVELHLTASGMGNTAARASVASALHGSLGEAAKKGTSYYIEIGGRKLDRGIVKGFAESAPGGHDTQVSAAEAKEKIVPAMADSGKLTPLEAETYLFCLRNFRTSQKASREALMPALRDLTGAPVELIGGKQGMKFEQLTDHLDRTGRLADLYSAKADMTDKEVVAMWEHGISLDDLNKHLESALTPRSEKELAGKVGADQVAEAKAWLKSKGDTGALARLATGKMSAGELQNIVYGSWEMKNTPFDPGYDAKFVAVPATVPAGRTTTAKLISDIEWFVAKKDWQGLMNCFDPANRETQKKVGVTSDAQYLAEGLGLHMVGNSLPGDIQSFDSLAQIKSLELGTSPVGDMGESSEYRGKAKLADGSSLDVAIFVEKRGDRFVVAPAVG